MPARRPHKDNVIYANFGANRKTVTRDDDLASVQQLNSRGRNRVSDWLAGIIETRAEPRRAKRGLTYYRSGHVLNFTTAGGRISADVAGSQNEPFRVAVVFPPRSKQDLQQAAEKVAAEPKQLDQIKAGKLKPELVHVLLAETPDEPRLYCECPDPVDCCKHLVAVIHHAIAAFDADPTLVFSLRSTTLVEFEQQTLDLTKEVSDKNAAKSPDNFWSGSTLPELPTPKTQSALDDSDLQLLHKAIRLVSFGSIDELRGVADVEDLYDALTHNHYE